MKHHGVVVENHLVSDEKIQLIRSNQWLCVAPYKFTQIRKTNKITWSSCCEMGYKQLHHIQNAKQSIKNKQLDSSCTNCYKLEKTNGISERMRYLMDYDQSILEEMIGNPLIIEKYIPEKYILIKLSRDCNLACRSCGERESNFYEKTLYNKQTLNMGNIFENEKDEKIVKEYILKCANENETINIILNGGEVFLDDKINKFLYWAIQENIAFKMALNITTNTQVKFKKKLINLLNQCKQIFLNLSIDGVGENYSYVRWPGKFSTVEQNLNDLENLKSEFFGDKLDYEITPVFSLNNIFYLRDYFDYFLNFIKKYNKPELNIRNFHLHYPEQLKIEILPNPYRSLLKDEMIRLLNHEIFSYPNTKVFYEWLKSIISSLENENCIDENLFLKYLNYTADYDSKTKQNSFELNSRLFDLLTEDHKNYYLKNKLIPIRSDI